VAYVLVPKSAELAEVMLEEERREGEEDWPRARERAKERLRRVVMPSSS